MVHVIDVLSPACGLFGVRELRCDRDGSTYVQNGVPVGAWSLGWFGVLADEAAGRPLIRHIPPGTHCPSVSLHLDLVRDPADMDGSEVTAHGNVVRVGEQVTLTEFSIEGGTGTPLVVGSMRNVRLGTGSGAACVSPVDINSTSIPAVAEPAADLGSLLDVAVEDREPGGVTLAWTPQPAHTNPVNTIHGGVHVALADVALTAAVTGDSGSGAWVMLGLDLSYHRSIQLNGGPISVRADILHAGRTCTVAQATIRARSGTLLTTARGTFVSAL